MSTALDLTELADRAGVSIRTVRYYIQAGLLPRPEARGPGAHYTEEHLDRLRLIRRLQKEHLPLAEIRHTIESGAREYSRSVPGRTSSDTPAEATHVNLVEERQSARSQWERVTLAPDLELHIRRPLSRAMNRQVAKLIDLARDLLEEHR